jgi:hypothetical protein
MPSLPPFDLPGVWLKGNLHTHTNQSDGAWPVEEVLRWHLENGYDFVALTDHDRITIPKSVPAGLIHLRSAELSVGRTRQGSPRHCLAIGLTATQIPSGLRDPGEAQAWVWEQGGFAAMAHPYWSGFSTDELAELAGLQAVEIYNHGCAQENDKGHAFAYWDDLLGRGRRIFGLAADDSHFRDSDSGGGWVVVRAAERSATGVMGALRDGAFYSTQGPTIEGLSLDGGRLVVQTSACAAIYWIGPGRFGWSQHAPAGGTIQQAEFRLKGKAEWFRATARSADGRWAWTQAYQTREPRAAEIDS